MQVSAAAAMCLSLCCLMFTFDVMAKASLNGKKKNLKSDAIVVTGDEIMAAVNTVLAPKSMNVEEKWTPEAPQDPRFKGLPGGPPPKSKTKE